MMTSSPTSSDAYPCPAVATIERRGLGTSLRTRGTD